MNNANASLVCVWIIMLLLAAHVCRHWDDVDATRHATTYLRMLYDRAK
jgi:hypothetical protein